MSNLTYRLAGMIVMLVAFVLAARVLVPLVGSPSFGRASWQVPMTGAALLAAPLLGLLLFELLSGRALGLGFSVVSRADAPREYWRWVSWHCAFLFAIAAATCAYFVSSR